MNSENFKILSEKPAATIIESSMIDRRMDAGCFQPMYLKNEDTLLNGSVPSARLGTLYTKGNYGSLPDSVDYATSGVALIRGTDLQSMAVNLVDAVRVPAHYFDQFKKAQINSGDILMLVKGASIDRSDSVAMFPETEDKAIANGSVFIIRANHKKINSKFLLAVMTSESFLLQKRRGSSNTGALYNDLDTIKAFIVPIPDPKIQEYIGKKVALAEICREKATEHIETAKKMLADLLGIDVFSSITPEISGKKPLKITSINPSCSVVFPRFIKNMIGAHAFAATHAQVELDMQNAEIHQLPLSKITTEMVNGYDCRDFTEAGTPYIKVAELKPGRIIKNPKQFVPISLSGVPKKQRVKVGDLLITRKGSFGICASATGEDEMSIISSEIIRLRLVSKYDSAFVSLFLNSNYGRSKFDRLATGTMMLGINHANLANIEIPVVDFNSQKAIGDKCRKRQAILYKSESLINSAKSDVESLIEGKLDTAAILSGKLKAPTWEEIEQELEVRSEETGGRR